MLELDPHAYSSGTRLSAARPLHRPFLLFQTPVAMLRLEEPDALIALVRVCGVPVGNHRLYPDKESRKALILPAAKEPCILPNLPFGQLLCLFMDEPPTPGNPPKTAVTLRPCFCIATCALCGLVAALLRASCPCPYGFPSVTLLRRPGFAVSASVAKGLQAI